MVVKGVGWGVVGRQGMGNRSDCLKGIVFLGSDEKVLELDSGEDCITL